MSRLRARLRKSLGWIPRPVRRVIIGVIGGTVLLLVPIGILLPIMPGWIFLPVALAILAVEFTWAARWLKKIKRAAAHVHQRVRKGMGTWSAAQPGCAPIAPPRPISARTIPKPTTTSDRARNAAA